MEEGFPDGKVLIEMRQEVDNETIARLKSRAARNRGCIRGGGHE